MFTPGAWKKSLAVLVLACLPALPACSSSQFQKPRAFGREKEILVICNDSVWDVIREPLRARVEIEFQAVRWEPIFTVAQINQEKVVHYKEWDKIILVESLEKMELLPDVVDEETMRKITEGQGLFFTQPDVWARGQRVVGLAAPKEEDLDRLVRLYGERVFQSFLTMLKAEEKERMFLSGVNHALADSLAECCGFSIILPKVYTRIDPDSLPPDQMLFVHMDPVRSVFIAWQDNPGPFDCSSERLAAFRDSLLAHVYPGMRTIPGRVDTSTVVSGGIPRTRLFGAWENLEQISGGIFVGQVIDSPEQNRRYIIDCFLFSPDHRQNKYRFIYQFDQILESFSLPASRIALTDG